MCVHHAAQLVSFVLLTAGKMKWAPKCALAPWSDVGCVIQDLGGRGGMHSAAAIDWPKMKAFRGAAA